MTRPAPPLSEEARRKREPLPVEELAGALDDRSHAERGKLVASRPLRCQRCGGPLTTDGRCRSVAPPMGGDE